MADLLECLLQIKGLRHTLDRLDAAVAQVPPDRDRAVAALVSRLAEIERVQGDAIRLFLSAERPSLPVVDEGTLSNLVQIDSLSSADALHRFGVLRRENLALLEACSAADLSRVGVHAVRRSMTLADLVAVMLATDVEIVGEIRRAVGHRGR